MLAEEIGNTYDTKVNIIFYKENIDVYNAFRKNNKLTMIILGTKFFYKNKEEIDKIANSYWSIALNTKAYRQLYLISNHKNHNFKDIKNKIVSFNKYDKTAFTWINKKSFELFKKPLFKLTQNIYRRKIRISCPIKSIFQKK